MSMCKYIYCIYVSYENKYVSDGVSVSVAAAPLPLLLLSSSLGLGGGLSLACALLLGEAGQGGLDVSL